MPRQRAAAAAWLLAVALLSAAAAVVAGGAASADGRQRDLIGWSEEGRGGTKGVHALGTEFADPDTHNAQAVAAPATRPRGLKVLSWEPRIFLYQRLLSGEECDHLIAKAAPRLSRSGVVETDNPVGEGISDIRTSYGMFFDRGEDEVIRNVERKLSEWSLIPEGHGEGIQVLRYTNGQEYKPHFDYFFDQVNGETNGGNRLATILMYLEEPELGGETVFPNVKPPPEQTLAGGFTKCAMEGLAVRPRKGDAVLFWSLRTEGTLDKGSMHGSCRVIKGRKQAATKWFHVAHYAMGGEQAVSVKHTTFVPPPPPTPPGCKDEKSACQGWAEGGECENNAPFMVGTIGNPGNCLLSCGRCDLMPQGLLRGNRRAGGVR